MKQFRLSFRNKILLATITPVLFIAIGISIILLLYRNIILSTSSSNLATTVAQVLATTVDITDFTLVDNQLKAAVASRDIAFIDIRPNKEATRFFRSKSTETDWYLVRQYDYAITTNPNNPQFIFIDQRAQTYQQQLDALGNNANQQQIGEHIREKIMTFQKTSNQKTTYDLIHAEIYDLPDGQRSVRFRQDPQPKGKKIFDLGVGVRSSDIQNVLDTQFILVLLLTSLVMLAATLLALLLGQRLAQPVMDITKAVNRISLGEINTPIQAATRDEIEDLGKAVERMRLSLVLAIRRANK
jgi:HAMP domain-containing protein